MPDARFASGYRVRAGLGIVVVLVALVGDVLLSESFLTAPAGVPAYLASAFPISWSAYALASAILLSGRPVSAAKRKHARTRTIVLAGSQVVAVCLALVSMVIVPIASGVVEHQVFHSDPIGVGDDVARGPCTSEDGTPASNHAGTVAVVRATLCTGNWDGNSMYFVFVHGPGDANTRENLVFRYDADPSPNMGPPKVFWKSAAELHVDNYHFVLGTPFLKSRIGSVTILCDSPFRSDK